MLQNDGARSLQYESDLRIAQQPSVEPTLYPEPTVITSVPRPITGRIPLPVSTVEFSSQLGVNRTCIPLSGLDMLMDMPSVHIEQTFELNETLTSVASENRYTIRSPLREALFAASESSESKHRMLWGSARPFQMHLLDKTHQEVLLLRKKFSMGILCCQPRTIEVWAPPGDLLGGIVESYSVFSTEFTIQSPNREILYEIEGPNTLGCCMPPEAFFKIFTPGVRALKGSITRVWSKDVSQYTTNIYFSDTELSSKTKALFIAAGFLLEYMYFQ